MLSTFAISIFLLQLFAFEASAVFVPPITVHAEFAAVNYTWDEAHTYKDYLDNGKYIVENNVIAGIKVDKMKNIYITVPRWLPGVPGTLNKLVKDSSTGAHVLQPFPSWDMQREAVDGDLQNCQSMLIDSQGIMWALEVGRRNFFLSESEHVDGAAGIWRIDLATGNVLETYYFPNEVMPYNSSFLNDLVLDEARDVAYLTDSAGPGGIIVYDHKRGLSRRYSGASTDNDPNYVVYINGIYYGGKIDTPADGIALSSDGEYIYYCAIQGDLLYRLPTSVLRDFSSSNSLIDQSVLILGKKQPSDGIVMWDDVLYFGSLPEATYYALDLTANKANDPSNAVAVWPDPVNMRWLDSVSLDLSDPNTIWFTSNALDLFIFGPMDFSGASGSNMRVLSAPRTQLSSTTSSSAEACEFSDSTGHALLALSITFGVLLLGLSVYFYIYSKKKLSDSNKSLLLN